MLLKLGKADRLGQIPLKGACEDADGKDGDDADNGAYNLANLVVRKDIDAEAVIECRADKTGKGVYMLSEDVGDPVKEEITHNTAADRGNHTHCDGKECVYAGIDADIYAGNGEGTKTHCIDIVVEVVDLFLLLHIPLFEGGCENEYKDGGHRADKDIHVHHSVKEECNGSVEHEVTEDTATEGGGKGNEHNAHKVHLLVDCDNGTRHTEGDDTDNLDYLNDNINHSAPRVKFSQAGEREPCPYARWRFSPRRSSLRPCGSRRLR